MFEKLRVVLTIPELRQKILLTLLMLAIYRVGYWIPVPIVDQAAVTRFFSQDQGGLGKFLQQVSVFSASNLNQATIFGLGIMPYISASIILQILGSVWKPLEELRKEGETGRKKLNEYTRYLTVGLCIIQSYFYVRALMGGGTDGSGSMIDASFLTNPPDPKSLSFGWQLVTVMTMTCGTIFLMWLGEQIDEFGIGNGISLLIMAGILARMPDALQNLFRNAEMKLTGEIGSAIGLETIIILVILFVAVVVGVIFITQGQRRIPTRSAKHVRGRRVFGGTRQYLPLRLNQSGVMPIIFASSLLMLPSLIFAFLGNWFPKYGSFFSNIKDVFSRGESFFYNLLYVALIYFFCYFWTAITFNPKEMSENLKDYGTFIPGYRPGRKTASYLEKVMLRITYVGAGFLSLVAIVPTIVSAFLGVDSQIAAFYGGTGLLIAVSVAFDLVQKIDSHLVMRNYSGLLED
jgi:preprotein translocase subunit SecY